MNMRRDASSKQSRLADFVEEETKVRHNLSRLIHTVQHMPSTRYRRDSSSLWDWVGELESFQPPNTSRSANPSQKTTRKSFSRKYLDLRLHPSTEKSSSPDCNYSKSQKQNKKPQPLNCNKSKTNKQTEITKTDTDDNVGYGDKACHDTRLLNNSKCNRKKTLKENVLPKGYKDKFISSGSQANSEPSRSLLKPRTKPNSLQSKRNLEGSKTRKCEKSSDQLHREKTKSSSNQKTVLIGKDRSSNYRVLDKLKELKNFNFIKNKCNSSDNFNETLKKALSSEHLFENDQASMVKTLTSYWNNLLNDDMDETELSSSHDSSDVSQINQSLQNMARNIYHNAKGSQRRKSLSLRKSESNVDTMKKLNDFNDGPDVLKNQKANKDQICERLNEILSNGHNNGCLHSNEEPLSDIKVEPSNSYFLEISYDKSCGDSTNLNRTDNKCNIREGFDPNCDLKTQHAIEVMEKLVRKLKRFSESSLTSNEINLSHSLRTMLCLMTATVLSSEEHIFYDYVEPKVEAGIIGDDDTAGKVDLRFLSEYSSDPSQSTENHSFTEQSNTNARNDNLQLVSVQGITMRKVEDALRYLTICKDYLWTEFLLSPRFVEEGLYNQDSGEHSPYFTFVIEEELLFEDDCDEEEFYFEDNSGNEEERNMGLVCKSVFDSISICIERLSELAADMIVHFWPDSLKEFVKTMYQTLVSLLVWWVITKEIFCK